MTQGSPVKVHVRLTHFDNNLHLITETRLNVGNINTLLPKIKKYQPAQISHTSIKNTLDRANITCLYQQQAWNAL